MTIGVFTAELNDSYQARVWEGILSSTRERGYGLVSFLGSRINSPIPQEASSNLIYRLADKRNIDALIIISSAISTYTSYQDIIALFNSRRDIPQVSIGMEIPGIPSISVDGDSGIKDMLEHLVTVHQSRNFALVTGPAAHIESEARKAVFFKTLKENGIDIDPDLIYTGSFQKESGSSAVEYLLNTGKSFDTVVCLNDNMALGALETLIERGLKVPEDVILTGFDGLEEADCGPLPLTTVRQPFGEIGSAAIMVLSELMQNGQAANRILTCNAVIGESCGCRLGPKPELESPATHPKTEDSDLLSYLDRILDNGSTQDFMNAVFSIYNSQAGDYRQLQDVMNLLHNLYLINRTSHAKSIDKTRVIMESLTMISGYAFRQQTWQRINLVERIRNSRSVGISIAESFAVPDILEKLSSGLSSLGFPHSFLVLYDTSDPDRTTARFYSLPHRADNPDQFWDLPFSTEHIVAPAAGLEWKDQQWVLVPLVFQAEKLGYLLLPAHKFDASVYDLLSRQIAGTLKGTILLDQIRSHEKNLENEVAKRTVELTRSNQRLTAEIEKRIRLEEEVVNISNQTMTRIGQDLHDDLCQHLAGISMISTALSKRLPEESDEARKAMQINQLIIDTIDRTKGIVRGLVPLGLEEQGFCVAIEALIEAITKSHGIPIKLEMDRNFELGEVERSIQVYRIIQEALSNSIKHSQCNTIVVRLKKITGRSTPGHPACRYLVEVSDNGKGIPEAKASQGMGLTIMRYRAEKADALFEMVQKRNKTGTTVRLYIQ